MNALEVVEHWRGVARDLTIERDQLAAEVRRLRTALGRVAADLGHPDAAELGDCLSAETAAALGEALSATDGGA